MEYKGGHQLSQAASLKHKIKLEPVEQEVLLEDVSKKKNPLFKKAEIQQVKLKQYGKI